MAEVIIAFCNVFVPSISLASGNAILPTATENLLWHFWLDPQFIGMLGILLGSAQIYAAGTEWYRLRALIATAIFCGLIALVTAYEFTGYDHRPTVPLMLGTIFGEMFLSWRCYHENPAPESSLAHGRVR